MAIARELAITALLIGVAGFVMWPKTGRLNAHLPIAVTSVALGIVVADFARRAVVAVKGSILSPASAGPNQRMDDAAPSLTRDISEVARRLGKETGIVVIGIFILKLSDVLDAWHLMWSLVH